MLVIGKFKLGSNTYAILDSNGKYRVGRLDKEKVSFKFNNEEKILIKEVIKRIIPVNDGVKLVPVKVNGNEYDISFDRSTNIFMFSPEPNINDLKILNNTFNNQHLEVYSGFIDKKNEYIKRFIKLGKKTLLVLLSSSILLSTSSCMKTDIEEQLDNDLDIEYEEVLDNIEDDKLINIIEEEPDIEIEVIDELDQDYLEEVQTSLDNNIKEEKVEEVQENLDNNIKEDVELEEISDKEDDFDFSKIEEAVNSNPNLSEEDKEFILSNRIIFEDSYPYYDMDIMVKYLSTLNIVYNYESNEAAFIQGTYGGENEIYIYNYDGGKISYGSTFTHEFSHMIQAVGLDTHYKEDNNYSNFRNNGALHEASNVIFNNEYFGNTTNHGYDGAYVMDVNFFKALEEILGDGLIKEYYYTNDNNLIASSLYNIIPDYEKINKLGLLIGEYSILVWYGYNCNFEYDSTELLKVIKNEISDFYTVKFNKDMNEDLLMLSYLDKAMFREKVGEIFDISDEYSSVVNIVSSKGVINPRLKDEPYVFEVEKNPVFIGYDSMPLEEARELGWIMEDGSMVFDNCYIDYESNMFMRAMYKFDDAKITFEINESNRYLSNDLSR